MAKDMKNHRCLILLQRCLLAKRQTLELIVRSEIKVIICPVTFLAALRGRLERSSFIASDFIMVIGV